MLAVRKSPLLLFFILAISQIAYGQKEYRPYPGARLQSNPLINFTDFPPAFSCTFEPDFENNFSIREAAATPYHTIDIVMPLVGDITGDGIPEIIIPAKPIDIGADKDGYGRPFFTSRTKDLLVYRMTADEQLVEIGRITTPYISLESPTQYVLAKIPGVGNENPLIIVAASWDPDNIHGGVDYSSRLVAYQWTGAGFNQVWRSNQPYGRNVPQSIREWDGNFYHYRSGGAPAVADFNNDNRPEVYIYNEIFDATNGNFIVDGGKERIVGADTIPMGQGISQISPGNTDEMMAGTLSVSVAADMNGDGKLELAAGNTVYRVNIAAKTMTPVFAPNSIGGQFPRDGFTSVADIDGDGQLDIIVTSSRYIREPNTRQLYIWTLPGTGSPLAGGLLKVIPDFNSGDFADVAISLPFIGDVNGDGRPNIGFTTGLRLWMLSYNGGALQGTWGPDFIQTNDLSGYTLITMFDFDQDGKQEIVYRDEENLRIIDGKNGADLFSFPSFSITAGEGAIVADVDLDGEAEILVTDRGRIWNSGNFQDQLDRSARLVVYKSVDKPWAPARRVWNQYPYFSFNVHEDLTIPSPQINHATVASIFFPRYDDFGCLTGDAQPFNSFLVQTTLYNNAGCTTVGMNLMDAKIEVLNSRWLCPQPDSQIEVVLNLINASDAIGDLNASIPKETPVAFYVDGVLIGQKTLEQLGVGNIAPGDNVEVTVILDSSITDNLSGSQVFSAIINWDESIEDDFKFVFDECIYDPFVENDLITRPIYSLNSPPSQCFEDETGIASSFTLIPTNTVDGSIDSEQLKWYLNNLTGAPLTTGGNYIIDDVDFSLTATGLAEGTYLFILLDECTNEITERIITVDPLPKPVFSSDDADCHDIASGQIFVENELPTYEFYVSGTLFDGEDFPVTKYSSKAELEGALFKAGDYSIRTVNEDGTNCEIVSLISLDHPEAILFLNIEEVDPSCVPDNGSISWSMKGGTSTGTFPFYHYILTNTTTNEVVENPAIIDLGDNQYKIENLIGGEYTLTAEDGQGCPVSESFTLIPQEDAVFDLPEDIVTCHGEEVIASVEMTSPGQPAINPGYIWGVIAGGNFTAISDGANTNGGVASISADGKTLTLTNLLPNTTGYEYAVRFSDACDYPDAVFSVIVNPLPEAAFENGTVSCFGGSDGEIVMSQAPTGSTTGFTYDLDGPVTGQNQTGNFIGLPEGTYMITVTNNDTGCIDVFENIIIYEPEPITDGDNGATDVTCGLENNGTAFFEFSGGTLPYTFVRIEKDGAELVGVSHETTEGRFDFTELEPGDYVLIAVDANGCPLPLVEVTVGEIPIPVVELSAEDICFGETLEIFASLVDAGGLTEPIYTWISSDGQELTGTNGNLNVGGTYQVIPGTGINPSGLILEGISSSLETYEFFLQVRGELSCDINESISFKVNPLPETTFDVDDATCFDSSTGKIKVSDDEPTYEYIVSGVVFDGSDFPETNFSNKTALEEATFKAGSYTIITLNVDGTNCQIVSEVEIDQPAEIILIAADASPVTCDGINNGSAYFEFDGGTKPYEFVSIEKDGVELAAVNFTINGGRFDFSDLEVGTYSLNALDANGCPLPINDIVVTETPVPDVELEVADICFGEKVTIVATLIDEGGLTIPEYTWIAPDGQRLTGSGSLNLGGSYELESVTGLAAPNLILSDTPDSDAPYVFTLELRGELSCDKDFAIEFYVHPIPAATFTKEDISCFDDQTGKVIVDNHTSTYAYYVSGTMYDGSAFTETKFESDNQLEEATFKAGEYSIRTVNENGTDCENSVDITIEQAEPIGFIEKGAEPVFCEGVDNGNAFFEFSGGTLPYEFISLERNGQPVTNANVTITDGLFEFIGLEVGTYTLTAVDALGCALPVETIEVEELPVPVLELTTSDQCYEEPIVLSANLTEIGGLTAPEYTWVSSDGQILTGTSGILTIGGTYEITPGSGIQPPTLVLDKVPAADARYEFTLQLRGEFSCERDFTTSFIVFPSPAAEFTAFDATCFDTESGKITVVGDVVSYTYYVTGSLFDGANYPETQFTSAADLESAAFKAGSYSIRITDSAGLDCESTRELTIDQPAPIELVSKEATPTTCDVSDSGSLVFEFTGGTAPYVFISLEKDGQAIGTTPNISDGRFEFTGLEVGEYVLNAVDANGCPFPVEALTIGAVPVPEVLISTDDQCYGELITLTADLVQQGSATTPEYTWISSDGQVLTGASGTLTIGGTYQINAGSGIQPPTLVLDKVPAADVAYEFTLQLHGELSCEGDFTASFSVFPAPLAEFTAADATCFDTDSGKITVDGDVPSYTYYVTGTMFDGSNYPEVVFTSAVNLEAANFKAGTYAIRITDADGLDCESVRQVTIDQPAPIEVVSKEATPTTCDVIDSGSLFFEFTGGTAPYVFISLKKDGQVISATPTISDGKFEFTGLEVGEYVLNAEDANGCPFPAEELSIGAVPVPEIAITTDDQCYGELITLTAELVQQGSATNPDYTWISSDGQVLTGANGTLTIGGTYQINAGSGIQPPTLVLDKVLAADAPYEFTLQLRGELSCEGDFTTSFSVFPAPLAEFTASDATCFDTDSGKITVDGDVPSYTYYVTGTMFDGSNYPEVVFTSAANLEAANFKAGTYAIRITDADGLDCESVRQVTIDQPAPIELVSKEATPTTCDVIDNGSLVYEFTGGTAPYVFISLEKDGQVINATPTISNGRFEFTGLEVGEYVLNAEDANGCPFPAEALTIGAVPVPEVEVQANDHCFGELTTITANLIQAGGMTQPKYIWVTSDGQVLSGNSGTLTIGGTYQIQAGTGNQPSTLILDRVPAANTPYEFILQLRGDLSCDGDFPISFTVNPAPVAEFTAIPVTCYDTETGKINVENGQASYRYYVTGTTYDGASFGETLFALASDLEEATFKAGTYTIRIIDLDGADCESLRTVEIDQPEELTLVEIGSGPVTCDGNQLGFIYFEYAGGTTPYTFVSLALDGTLINGITHPATDGRFEFRDLEAGEYTLTATDANGCELQIEAVIVENLPTPDIALEGMDVCFGEVVTLTATLLEKGGMITPVYTWVASDGQRLIAASGNLTVGGTYEVVAGTGNNPPNLILKNVPASATPYEFILELRGDFSCDKDFAVGFQVNPAPDPELGVENILCFGEDSGRIFVSQRGQSSYLYSINGANPVSQDIMEATGYGAGIYDIVISSSEFECITTRQVEITQPEPIVVTAIDKEDPTCDEANGLIEFSITGGVPGYVVNVNGANIETYPDYSQNGNVYQLRDLLPGNYQIEVIDQNECLAVLTETFDLTNIDGAPIDINPMEDLVCEGNPLTFIPEIASTGTQKPVMRWYRDANLTQQITSNFTAGGTGEMFDIDQATGQLKVYNKGVGEYTYYLRLSGLEYCVTSAVATGEVIPGLSADVKATDLICFGDENGTITITSVNGGSGDFEYSLDGTVWQAENVFNDLVAGEYTITVKDVGSNSNCTLEIPNVIVGAPAGQIEINDDPVIIGVGCGQDNGEISNIQVSGGWDNYTFVWKYNDVNATSNFAENTLSLKGLATGTYYLIVTDVKGCEAIFEFLIEDLPDPNFEKVEVDEFCEADDIKLKVINTVSGSAPTEVIWSKGPNQTNPIAEGEDPSIPGLIYTFGEELNNYFLDLKGVQAGTYTYYFYAVCTDQEIRFDFIVKDSPEPEFDKLDLTCDPDSFGKILVMPGYEDDWRYSIDGGNTYLTKDQLKALELSAGDYEVLSINSIDCPGVPKLITIGIPNPLLAELVEFKDSACGTDNGVISIAIQGGTPTYTINLYKDGQLIESVSTSANTYSFTGLGPGAYNFEVNDTLGCSDSVNDGIDLVDGPSDINVDDVIICVGEDVVFSPEVFPTVANPQFTWYSGTLANGNEISNNQVINGATYTFNASGALVIRGLAADASLELWVTVSGAGVCEGAEKLVRVSVDSQPEFTAEADEETCFGSGGAIRLTPSEPNEELVYSLNGGAYQSYPENIIEGLEPGSYTIRAMNEAGCIYELPDAIVVEGPISPLAIEDVVATNSACDEATGTLAGRINGGSPVYNINVYDNAGNQVGNSLVQTELSFLFEGLPSGEFTVRVTDGNGCVDESPVAYVRSVEVDIDAHDAEICEGEVAVINASISSTVENAQFKWYYDNGRQNAVLVDGAADQFGAIYRSNEFGEISMAGLPGRDEPYIFFLDLEADGVCPPDLVEVRVKVNPLPTLRVSNPSIVCDPTQTVDLTEFIEGFNPTVFDYIVTAPNGNTMRMEDLKNVSLTGSYTVQAGFRGSTCMTATERIAVVISNNRLEAYFQFEVNVAGSSEPLVDGEVQAGEPIQFRDLSQGNVIIWNWEFGNGNFSSEQHPVHQYEEEGEYIVRLTTIDEFGCTDVIERRIIVFDDYLVIIPNAFTPGGSQNQHFFPKFRGIATMEFMVFNTWGDLIYVTDNLEDRGWDGTLNGINAPNGNYVYKAKFLSRTGHSFTRTGVFILIR